MVKIVKTKEQKSIEMDIKNLIVTIFVYGIVAGIVIKIFSKFIPLTKLPLSLQPVWLLPLHFLLVCMMCVGIIIIPARIIYYWISRGILFYEFKKIKMNKSTHAVIIVGENNPKNLWYLCNPNYSLEILTIIDYLKLKGNEFSVNIIKEKEDLDKIMFDKNVKEIYLLGHGRRHSFKLKDGEVIDYCRYKDCTKDFVFQLHCNHDGGESLAEYVVPEKNKSICVPGHDYSREFTTNDGFIKKIKEIKSLNILELMKYKLPVIVNIFSVVIWVLIIILIFILF